MIRALYSASSGMVAQSAKQDVIANNIANAQTPGFKRLRVGESSFAQALQNSTLAAMDRRRSAYPDSAEPTVIVQAESASDLTQGALQTTGGTYDAAIDGPGAFEVADASGTRLTRNGSFRVTSDGELITADGAKVQGNSGDIRIPKGECRIMTDGTITVNGAEVDKIKLVGADADQTRVLQGCLESANVNAVTEMVDMIANMRAYEANQKVITSVDSTLDKLISEVGRV